MTAVHIAFLIGILSGATALVAAAVNGSWTSGASVLVGAVVGWVASTVLINLMTRERS